MAIGAITMILTNVGLQMYNNWCGSRQNAELQKKREEFERAARERNTEHMWKLLREGQELTMQLEEERHQHRLDELKSEIDNLLQKLTYETAISNWPLKVLPLVMKNQAFGNLLANQEERVAMHVILTRSNHDSFNKLVYPIVEQELEQFCDSNWSTMSDHPIMFYSGAWKPMNSPTEVQVSSLRTALSNLPTLLITPFYRPNDGKLVFQIQMWGVGSSNTDKFDIPEIEPTDFQREFTNKDDYENEIGLLDEIVEDLVPYLQCLIGYMTDTYFWSSAGLAPLLPSLIMNGVIDTDGMKYLVSDSCEYYNNLLLSAEEEAKDNPFVQYSLLNLYNGSHELWDEETQKKKLEKVFLSYCCAKSRYDITDINLALNTAFFSIEDLPFIEASLTYFKGSKYETKLNHIRSVLASVDFNYNILSSNDIDYLKEKSDGGDAIAAYRLGEIYEYSVGTKWDQELANKYYDCAEKAGILFVKLKQNPALYEQYKEEIECLINSGVAQSVLVKVNWLCSLNNIEEALTLLNNFETKHPALLFKKAKIILELNGDDVIIEDILTNLANNGYVKAQELLCELYQKGDILKESPQKHAEYAEKAMLQNSPFATYAMALCYLNGYGVQQSTSAAIMLIDKAEELGWSEARRIKALLNSI